MIYRSGLNRKSCFFFYQKEYGSPSKLRFSDVLLPKGNVFVLVSFKKKRLTAGLPLYTPGIGPSIEMCIRYSSPFSSILFL